MRTTVDPLPKLISHINRKAWWHVPPLDPAAYRKRGKFYASSFREAEFWGRPLDRPERVRISNPLVGDEETIEMRLFGRVVPMQGTDVSDPIKWRHRMDKRMKREALAKGFDSIVLMTAEAHSAHKESGKVPRSIELNVLRS